MTKILQTLNAYLLDTTKCCASVDRLKQFCLCRRYQGDNEVILIYYNIISFEDGRGAGAQSVTVNVAGCGFDPHSRK